MKSGLFVKKLSVASKFLAQIGNISIAAMTLLSASDVVGRYFFNSPILGAYEMTEYLMLIMVFSYLGITQSGKCHVNVDIVYNHLPAKVQFLFMKFNYIVCFAMMVIVSWMGVEKTLSNIKDGDASILLKIPDYPFAIFLTIGSIVLALEFFKDILFTNEKDKQEVCE